MIFSKAAPIFIDLKTKMMCKICGYLKKILSLPNRKVKKMKVGHKYNTAISGAIERLKTDGIQISMSKKPSSSLVIPIDYNGKTISHKISSRKIQESYKRALVYGEKI